MRFWRFFAGNLFGQAVVYCLQKVNLRRPSPMNLLPYRNTGVRLAIICAAALAAAAYIPSAQAQEVVKSFTIAGRANVHVDTNDGGVHVSTSSDSKQIEFRVEYQGYELGKNLTVDAKQDG